MMDYKNLVNELLSMKLEDSTFYNNEIENKISVIDSLISYLNSKKDSNNDDMVKSLNNMKCELPNSIFIELASTYLSVISEKVKDDLNSILGYESKIADIPYVNELFDYSIIPTLQSCNNFLLDNVRTLINKEDRKSEPDYDSHRKLHNLKRGLRFNVSALGAKLAKINTVCFDDSMKEEYDAQEFFVDKKEGKITRLFSIYLDNIEDVIIGHYTKSIESEFLCEAAKIRPELMPKIKELVQNYKESCLLIPKYFKQYNDKIDIDFLREVLLNNVNIGSVRKSLLNNYEENMYT